jgi:hypothetical protein
MKSIGSQARALNGPSRPLRASLILVSLLAALAASPAIHAITVTEILYNSTSGGADESLEFVEIFNDSPIAYDLSGCYFSEGIQLAFPEGTFLKSQAYLAVCANAAAIKKLYPDANVVGDFQGHLAKDGEVISLVTASGSPLTEVSYKDRGAWPTSADGTGYSLSLKRPFADPRVPANWTRSSVPGGTPGSENFPPPVAMSHEIFPETGAAARWKYKKGWNESTQQMEGFSTPSGAWRDPGFDDASWAEGESPLGFNEIEIATRLDDMQNHYLAFAARKRFQLTAAEIEAMDFLILTVRLDDGCVVYLNGEEVGRFNLGGDPGTEVPVDALATTARESGKATKPVVFNLPKEKAHTGENLIAVQVHNSTLDSNDAALIPSLAYQTTLFSLPPPSTSVVFNEIVSRAPASQRSVELYNTLGTEIDLSGYVLAIEPQNPKGYTFPAGTKASPGGFISLEESTLGFSLAAEELSLFLFAPDAKTVVDAVTVEDEARLPAAPQSHARYPDGDGAWSISVPPTPGSANHVEVETGLVINEIHFNPKLVSEISKPLSKTEQGEYIEIYNRSNRAIPMEGFRLASGFNYSFTAGTTPAAGLAAGGYLVVARDPRYIQDTYGLPASQVLGPSPAATPEELAAFGSLKNKGERVKLLDSLGNTVDEVPYRDEGEWPSLADGGGSSLELIDPSQDNSFPSAWEASDESKGGPWKEISFDATYVSSLAPSPMESELHIFLISEGECLIDGVSILAGAPQAEYVPNGDFEADTRPWRLTGTHIRSFRTTEEAKIGSACLRLVATGSGDNRVNRIELDTTPQLKAGPLHFSMWGRWLKGSNALHISGYNNAFGTTVYLPVPKSTGTPGRENNARERLRQASGSDNLGPVISGVRQEPAVPAANSAIRFSARVMDADGVASVEALYQKDGAATFDRAQLFDDGAHDDGKAGDGLYSAEIPGYPAKTLINFMIEAKDSGGRSKLFPRDAPDNSLLFIVDDPMSSTVFRYRLLVNAKNLNTPNTGLARRLLHSDELVHGTFIFEESEVYYDIGLRYHGSPWNRPPDPKMFRVRFNGDKPFLDDAKRINISRYGTVQREGTAYQLLQKAGVPGLHVPYSPRYQYINMKLNGGPHGTALAEIRPIDSEYIHFHWPSDDNGPAWKVTGKLAFTDGGQMAGNGPDWTQFKAYKNGPYPGTDSPENYRYYYNPTVNPDEDDFEPLIRLLTTMDRSTTPDADYEEKIQQILNVEASLRVFAVRAFLADWDTIGIQNGQNAYLYYAPIEGRNYLVPWDMDHTFEQSGIAIAPASGTNGISRLISRPVFRRLYARILKELTESSWSNAYVSNWIKLVNETGRGGRVADGTSDLNFLNVRRGAVNNFIRSGTGVPFAITSPNPLGASSSARITGTAPIEVAQLFASVNRGDPAQTEPIWSPPRGQASSLPTSWEITVDGILPGKKNEVEFLAFDGEGNLLASKTIDAYDTTGWAPPSVESVSPDSGPIEGGTEITIHGSGFQPGAQVSLGGNAAASVVLVSPAELKASTPAGSDGPADLV